MPKSRFAERAAWLVAAGVMSFVVSCAPRGDTPGWERSDGSTILRRAVEAHGGIARWRGFRQASFRYREHWHFPFQPWNPWPWNDVDLAITLWLHQARATAISRGHPGHSWYWRGEHFGASWPDGTRRLDWMPKFVLPRTHYITLLPWKFLDRGAHAEYLGREGAVEKVLITFDPRAGTSPQDRYWAYFNAASGRLERVILTVTAYGPLAVGDLRYEGWHRVRGMLMPARIRALWSGPELPLHTDEYFDWRIE